MNFFKHIKEIANCVKHKKTLSDNKQTTIKQKQTITDASSIKQELSIEKIISNIEPEGGFDLYTELMSDIKLETSSDIRLKEAETKIKRLEDMLSDKNAKCVTAQALMVTNHALSRYREHIGFHGSDDDLRKLIYKEALKHLATMDKLPDGKYPIANNAILRIKDNTVCTVTPRVGLGRKALATNREQQSARDKYNHNKKLTIVKKAK